MKQKQPLPLEQGVMIIIKHWHEPLEVVIKETGYTIWQLRRIVKELRKAGVPLKDRRKKAVDWSKLAAPICATCFGEKKINKDGEEVDCPACNWKDEL